MMITTTELMLILLAACAAIGLAALLVTLRLQAQVRSYKDILERVEQSIAQPAAPPDFPNTHALERKVSELHRVVETLARRSVPAPVPADRSIGHAVRMARHGAAVEDLTRACGLKAAEAALLKRLHA